MLCICSCNRRAGYISIDFKHLSVFSRVFSHHIKHVHFSSRSHTLDVSEPRLTEEIDTRFGRPNRLRVPCVGLSSVSMPPYASFVRRTHGCRHVQTFAPWFWTCLCWRPLDIGHETCATCLDFLESLEIWKS